MPHRLQRIVAALPHGGGLDDVRWERHHRLLLWVLVLHIPVLAIVVSCSEWIMSALDAGRWLLGMRPVTPLEGILPARLAVVALVVLAVLGWRLPKRRDRSLAVALGLVLCSVLLVHAAGGLIEAHFHFFVMLGFVALYHDWRPYAMALGAIVVSHGALGALEPTAMYDHPAGMTRPWLWGGIHGGFLLLASVSQVVLWKISEHEQDRSRGYYAELYGSERALIARLREAERAKAELMALVSHEFRTPLTGIIGSARTLDRRYDDLDADQVRTLLGNVDHHARRLSRLVDNLVSAAGVDHADPSASADVGAIVAAVVDDIGPHADAVGHRLQFSVCGEVVAMVDERAVRRVAANLLDNAVKFSDPGTEVAVRVRRDGDDVLIEVENIGPPLPADARLPLGEPFAQGDSSDTRRADGMGLGLHVVRSLVSSYDGSLELREGGGRVLFRVRLHARRAAPEGRQLAANA